MVPEAVSASVPEVRMTPTKALEAITKLGTSITAVPGGAVVRDEADEALADPDQLEPHRRSGTGGGAASALPSAVAVSVGWTSAAGAAASATAARRRARAGDGMSSVLVRLPSSWARRCSR